MRIKLCLSCLFHYCIGRPSFFLTISHMRKIKTSISVERIESLQNAAVNLPLSMAWEQFGSVRNSSLAIILAYYVDFRMLFVLFLSYHTLL